MRKQRLENLEHHDDILTDELIPIKLPFQTSIGGVAVIGRTDDAPRLNKGLSPPKFGDDIHDIMTLMRELSRMGTHKRTYRIRSKVCSELAPHIIVSTAYTSTIFKKNKN